MNAPDSDSTKPTRRQFIQRTATGVSLLGLGGATGLLASNANPPTSPAARTGRALGKEFSYNLSALVEVDPKLVQFTENEALATGFNEVRAIAITPEDHLYVAGDEAVKVFDKKGHAINEFQVGGAPRCLSVTRESVFVGLQDHVEVFNASGIRQARWDKLDEKAHITSMATTKDYVFVADAGNRVVLRYDLSGKLQRVIGKRDLTKNIVGFAVPSPYFHLLVGTDGLLWVVNPAKHRLEAFNFDGEFQKAWGESANAVHGFCGCCNPVHFTQMADGRFVTSEKGLPRVKVYSARGDFESVVAVPTQFPKQLESPKAVKVCMDLAVNSSGQILMADAVVGKIRIFSPKLTSEVSA